ncbi:MAG: LamG domain-containing protein [Planctomycetaceae bacterium]
MKSRTHLLCLVALGLFTSAVSAEDLAALGKALTLHASFDAGLNADYSAGSPDCVVAVGKELQPAEFNDHLQAIPDGRFGSAMRFPHKSTYRPQFAGAGTLDYSPTDWNRSVSLWMRLDPDRDLEPGYCDPVQILGDSTPAGFIFLEWSKDHTPRHFRFAVRPLVTIWNPKNVGWEEIPDDQRPMVKVEKKPFRRDRWTHVVFTLEHLNNATVNPQARLFIDGEPRGAIENWDLRLGWTPEQVRLVLGASFVGDMDDLAVFDRALTAAEVKQLHQLPGGVSKLRTRSR